MNSILGKRAPMQDGINVAQATARLDGFRILTEYECGRAQMAIEWVSRSQKPIVEIGGRALNDCDLRALAHDLNRCIATSGESVRAFVIPDKTPGYCCYGFYRHPWAIKALLFAWGIEREDHNREHQSLWLQGLVFGYSPDAIQRFMSSASGARASNSRSCQRSEFSRYRKVEIYGIPVSPARRHNSQSGKSRTFD
jgi:hypothetical protein